MAPLFARAVETQRPDALFNDKLAVAMLDQIDYDYSRFEESIMSNTGIAIRTVIFDTLVSDFIARNPEAVVINIAAGLDTRFTRVDSGRLLWYDIDLPQSIDVRRQVFTQTARNKQIAHDILTPGWAGEIERREATLIIIEGLLMYFTESQVRNLLNMLIDSFPGAEILAEVIGVTQAKRTHANDAISKTSAQFKWGIRDASSMAEWHRALSYVEDISIYDLYPERWQETGFQFPAPLADLRNTVDRIVHLRIAEAPPDRA